MPPAGTALPDGLKQLGQYRLLSQLAVGGMAEIYVAKAAGVGGFEKLVALKVIHPNYSEDPEFVQMLVDEAKLAVQLQHANIVQTFDLGRVENQYYIAMELIDGVDLYKLLRTASDKEVEFPFEVAAFIAMETCNGLDYAHRKRDSKGRPLQIVHRDISPQNILVSNDGEVKIVDFGIAKAALRGRQTAAGVIKGKYYYMSPEQAWGDPIDARTDVFSTGILLYEMIVGQMLYLEDDLETLLLKVRKADIAPPSMLRGHVPEELEEIVMTALKKKVTDRFQSAQELSQALASWIHKTSPDFNRSRLGTFLHQVLGSTPNQNQTDDPQTVTRDPRIPTAHTREMLERDENSLLFKIADLQPPAPAKPRPPDQATRDVALPEQNRMMARAPKVSDFEESDQTVVDTGNTLLANVQPQKLEDDPAADDTLFDDEDEATLAGEPPPPSASGSKARDLPTLKAQPQPSDDSAPLPGMRPLEERPTVAKPRTSGVRQAPPQLSENDVDEATALHKKPKNRPRPMPGSPVPVPLPDSSESVTIERQRKITSPQKANAGMRVSDEAPTPPINIGVMPRPVPVNDTGPTPATNPMHPDEPTRIPPPVPAEGQSGLLDVWGLPTVSASDLPGSSAPRDPGSSEIHSTDLVPRKTLSGLRTMVVVLVIAALALSVVVALLVFGGSGSSKAAIEVVSSPPGAEVNIDGAALGRVTPLRITDVDVHSAHHVRVSLKGYDVWESDVRFVDAPTVRLQAVLVPTVGSLILTSVPPGAEAIVNGRIRGLTPVTVGDLPPNDEVSIELRLRGFKAVRIAKSFQGSRKLEVQIPLEKAR